MAFGVGTTIDGGTDQRILYDNAGVVGEDGSFRWDDDAKTLLQASASLGTNTAKPLVQYSTDDPYAKPFGLAVGAGVNDEGTRNNVIFNWGYNIGLTGPIDASECSWGIQTETYWHPNSSFANVEYFLTYMSASTPRVVRRPFQYRVNRLNDEVLTHYAADVISWFSNGLLPADEYLRFKPDQVIFGPDCALQWTNVQDFTGTPDHDVQVVRGGVGILDLQNGDGAQTLRIYNKYSGAGANYERFAFGWSGDVMLCREEHGGTGSARSLQFSVGANSISFSNNWAGVEVAGATWRPVTGADGLMNLGEGSTPLRWGKCFLKESIQIDSDGAFVLTSQTDGAGSGVGSLGNAPHAGNPDAWITVYRNGVKGWIPWFHA